MKRLHGPVPRRNYTGLLASLVAIVIGLLLGFLVLALCNPPQAANGIKTLMLGGFTGGMKGLGNVLYYGDAHHYDGSWRRPCVPDKPF